MKRLNLMFVLTLFWGMTILSFISCSEDDTSPKYSKIVEKIDLYEGTNVQQNHVSTMNFIYNRDRQLIQINMDSPLSEVRYTYLSDNEITYSFSSGNSPFVKVEAELEDDKARTCTFRNGGEEVVYSYDKQYLSKSKGDITMTYEWKSGNLQAVSSSNRLYESKYEASSVANDYNIDLNVLSQLVDTRDGYLTAMNTFGQLIDILGERSRNIIEDTYYDYEYSYDEYRRLKEITLKVKESPLAAKVDTYSFRISYENK